MNRWLVGVILSIIGLALGWLARDAALGTNVAAWLGGAGLVIVAAVLGAGIGALGAYMVAAQNRSEASRTRFHDDLLRLARDLHQAAAWHTKQRRAQFARWTEVAESPALGASSIPEVDDTEPIYAAALSLELVASRDAILAGWALYRAARNLDRDLLTYIHDPAIPDGGPIAGPSDTAASILDRMRADHRHSAFAFVNAVRHELGFPDAPEELREEIANKESFVDVFANEAVGTSDAADAVVSSAETETPS
jgi:hypothetical protein